MTGIHLLGLGLVVPVLGQPLLQRLLDRRRRGWGAEDGRIWGRKFIRIVRDLDRIVAAERPLVSDRHVGTLLEEVLDGVR